MQILIKFFEGVSAALKGMMSVAGFGILAVLLPLMMLKMKGTEGHEIVRSTPKLKATQASLAEVPIIPEMANPRTLPLEAKDPNSFSFGNSIEQDNRPVLDRSIDPNELK